MDSQRAKAAATFGKAFMDEARSNPQPPKSSVTSSQAIANKRPIPTYAAGGKVARCAAGGVAKKRHGVTDPGRGPKLI